MADIAQVRSIDELDAFRSKLIVFQSKARKAVDQASEEVRRMRLWLDSDRQPFWEAQVKKRLRLLEQAQQELLSARMSEFVDNPVVQQQNVRKAKAALEEAEEKLRAVKHWIRNFETTVQPMAKKLEGVTGFIDFDIPQAIMSMSQFIRTLDAYAERLGTNQGGDKLPEEASSTATEPPHAGS
jgi:chromosome segregation ATPase